MNWKFTSDAPIYSQLVEQFKRAIASGEYAPGERLRSVRELAVEAGVNPNTMQRALSELERDGLVFSQRTSGRYVTQDVELIEQAKSSLADEIIGGFLTAMSELGYSLSAIISLLKENEADGNT